MNELNDKFEASKLRSSNLTVGISITLILVMLGILGVLFINLNYYTNYIKEKLTIEVFFKDNQDSKVREETVQKKHLTFINKIKKYNFVKEVNYLSKKKASEIAIKDLGLKELNLFEEDIYPASVNISLNSNYFEPEKIKDIKNILLKNDLVDEVVNDNELMVAVYQNINKITLWAVAIASLFLLIVVVLINNSIRLKIYSKRFIIKTMQLVGAKRSFILRPFLIESLKTGLISAIIAFLIIFFLWFNVIKYTGISLTTNYTDYGILAGLILLIGVGIALMSTLLATWRFLHLRTEDLYYS
ncbi:MAG: cell division protein FtsX [Solirubrobacteraceae bacterium]